MKRKNLVSNELIRAKLSSYKDHEGDVWSVSPSSELFLDWFRFTRLALIDGKAN